MYLGQHPRRLCTISEIAAYHDISHAHLMKVTHLLAKGGWIKTQRGKHGGMQLAIPAHEINLGALIRYTESDLALVECLGDGSRCILNGQCHLSRLLDQALKQFLAYLDGYFLIDLLRPDAAPEITISIIKPPQERAAI